MPDSVIRDRLKQNNVKYDGRNMETTYEQEEDGDPWKSRETAPPAQNPLPDHLVTKSE